MDECRVLVLFVCTGNAGRSQIAEELFRRVAPAGVAATSAGVDPWKHVHPMAARVLAERDIDISRKTPRHVRERIDETFGLVVTIGDPARDEAPDFAGHPVRLHWDIGDPADADGTPDSESVFRHVLSAISDRLDGLLDVVGNSVPNVAPFSAGISTCVVRRARFEPASHLPLIARAIRGRWLAGSNRARRTTHVEIPAENGATFGTELPTTSSSPSSRSEMADRTCRNTLSESGVPSASAGSPMSQCRRTGCPAKSGASSRAGSPIVTTSPNVSSIRSRTWRGVFLLMSISLSARTRAAIGCTCFHGSTPALVAATPAGATRRNSSSAI